ncbi:MAG: AAA family ATPase [Candidatus Gastranaerophilales bacterium]|nr:AAA family ATPase [Candidatus Gastranaerophilales bacterium]
MLYCEKDFDAKTMEFVGIFIKKYRCFENQFFSLHPLIKGRVSKKNGKFTIHLYDNGEYDLFREKKINVITLCGKNGCGKSTLINQISEGFEYEKTRILFFIDEKKHLATSEEINLHFNNRFCKIDNQIKFDINEILNNDYRGLEYRDYRGFRYREEFERHFFNHYVENPSLFSFENDDKLLTHYEIRLDSDKLRKCIQVYLEKIPKRSALNKIQWENNIVESDYNLVKYPLYTLVLFCLDKFFQMFGESDEKNINPFSIDCSDSFEQIKEKIRKKMQRIDKQNITLRNLLFSNHESYKYGFRIPYKKIEIESAQKLKIQKKWLKKVVHDILYSIANMIFQNRHDDGMLMMVVRDFEEKYGEDIFFFTPYKLMNNGNRYLSDLSEGQKRSLINRQLIFDSLKNKKYIITFDEPENAYHPEMSRCFWTNLVKEVDFTKKYIRKEIESSSESLRMRKKISERYVTIVVATHSPFLLSDLFRHNILALENKGDGFVREAEIKNTFAGNIAEILCDSMFMNGMIGAFAEEQIQSVFRKKIIDESDLNNRKQLIEQIGDPILKNLLMSELEK